MSRRRPPPSAPINPPAEQLLMDVLPECEGERMLCSSIARGQFAAAAAEALPQTRIICHQFDAYGAEQVRYAAPSVEVACIPDFPEVDGGFDLVALPTRRTGDSELTREVLQMAHLRLREGGRLLMSTDNPKDSWLHDELRKHFDKVTRRPERSGVLYLMTKTRPLKKIKNYEAEFAFRDQGRLIWAITRPGVFSHRELDGGARELMHVLEILRGQKTRVLDIGCGSGAVALAAACRSPEVSVVALDSHTRAIQCTQRGAARNELTNVETVLNHEGIAGPPATFDIAVANPPYFSNYRIAEIFLAAAARSLKPGGTVLVVTKTPHWFEERMPGMFDHLESIPGQNYVVLRGRQPL